METSFKCRECGGTTDHVIEKVNMNAYYMHFLEDKENDIEDTDGIKPIHFECPHCQAVIPGDQLESLNIDFNASKD